MVPDISDTRFFRNKQPRNTLYWNTNIATDVTGKAQISFYLTKEETKASPIVHCEGYSSEGLIGAEASRCEIENEN